MRAVKANVTIATAKQNTPFLGYCSDRNWGWFWLSCTSGMLQPICLGSETCVTKIVFPAVASQIIQSTNSGGRKFST